MTLAIRKGTMDKASENIEKCFRRDNASGVDEDGVPIKGDPKCFYGKALLVFIDLLGFSNAVLRNWGDGNDSPLKRLLRIKNAPVISRPERQVVFAVYNDGPNGKPIRHYNYRSRAQMISDSIVISVALPQELTLGDLMLATVSLVNRLLQVWRKAISEGFTIRGTLEFGDIFWNESDIVGPALVKAFFYEKNVAESSRVIVGRDCISIILNALRCSQEIRASVQRDILPFMMKDNDGLIAVDPTGLIAVGRKGNLEKLKALRSKCSESEHSRKYDRLISYLDDPSTIVPADENGLVAALSKLKMREDASRR